MKRASTFLAALLFTATAIFADLPFRNHRYDAFKPLPVTSDNIVFIGNSITNMHEWWEAFGDPNVVNRGVSGAITDEALENIEAIAAGKPKKVFILIGTNDLGTAGICTTEHVLQNVTLMVERFQKVSPETKLYIQSILPSGHLGSGGTRTPERLKATNVALKALCEERSITYIDLWDELQDIATGANEFSYDKLHLTANAYKVWCDKIAPYVTDKADAKSLYSDKQQSNGGLGGSHGMRATVFSKLPVNSTDILILGDGMVHSGEWHELLQSNRVKGRGTGWGFPGASLADATKLIEPSFHDGATPSQVYLHMAASDVLGSTELATILTSYKAAVVKIQQLSANTEIVLTSILPTNDATKNSNRVVEFNKLLKAYADESTTDKIHYLDLYTDFVNAEGKANTSLFNGNYLYGRGYVKVAQKIAEQINALEPTANITAITDATAEELFTRFESRTALGKAIVTASLLPEGDGVGQYTTANLAGVKAQIEAAYTALKENDADAIATTAAAFTEAVNAVLPKINMPSYSTEQNEVWYQMSTPGRLNKYLASTGAGAGVVGVDKDNYPTSMWKFVTRADGKGLDIINRHDKSFLAPTASHNTQLNTSATQPTNGWTLSYSNTAGRFIVASGSVQLNQTDKAGTPVYNWGGGTDRNDTGCQYQITLVENEPDEMPDPSELTLTLGIDQFANGASTWTKNVSTSDGWYGKFVTGTTPAVTVESTDKSVNNMGWSQKRPWLKTGYSYNISLPKRFLITGYELTTLDASGFNGTFTYTTAEGTATSPAQTNTAQTVTTEGLSTQTVTLKIGSGTDGDKGIMITKLTIHYKEAPEYSEEEVPAELVYTIDKANGNLYNGANPNQNWNSAWKSNAEPQLLFSCGTNNMNWSGNNVQMMTGTAGRSTYTLTAPAGYVITAYSFTFANNGHNTGLDLTMDNGAAYTTSTTAQTISANNQKVSSMSFVLAGNNGKGVVLTNFTVKVKEDKLETAKISTEGNEYWYYITSASTKDYCKGQVMYYDKDMGKIRFGEKTFSASHIWSFWEKDGKLAIKNYKGEYFGTAGAGTGGSTSFGVVNEANHIYTISSAYGAYIIKDNAVELHAQNDNKVIVRWGAEAGGASLWKFDEVDTSHSMAELANTKVEQGKVTTGIGNTDQPIVRATIRISGLESKVTFQGVKGSFAGTDKANITNVKAYFATNSRELFVDPDQKMTWREENGVQFGETTTLAADGTFAITGSKDLEPGDYYLWITYDIAENAKEGNTVDASITSYTIDGKEVTENNGNPKHSVTIFLSEGAVLMPMDKGSLYYRIPSITATVDGKRLVTLTDDRKQHNSDLPSHCYLVAQYSEDNGKTWSDPITVAGTAETGGNYGHGDASIVTNRDNGEIVGIMTSAGTYGHGFFAGTSAEPPRWKTITSRDGGLTWETPVDHTDDLFGANCDNPDTKTWKSGFSGSGAALQKRDGTLVSNFVNRQADNSQHFYFFMSKDGGKNWYVSGTSGTASADEPKSLERNNGDLAISVRASGYNYYNVTSDDGATWKYPSQTRFTTGITGNACDGEYMVWCSTVEGNPWDIALQTIPNSGSRENVSIALSTDEGATFGTPKTICPRGSAYSATVVLPDGTLGCYYEENGLFGGYTMRFVRFSLDWASNGAYKFTEANPFKPIKSTNATDIEVEKTDNGQQTTVIYDLQGRRIDNPTKGIYIVNGRKVVIK